jgi:hypothetical protein
MEIPDRHDCLSYTNQSLLHERGGSKGIRRLRFNYFAAAQAIGADTHTLAVAARGLRADRPQVDVPAALSHIVRVADIISGARPFAANLTYLCHDNLR